MSGQDPGFQRGDVLTSADDGVGVVGFAVVAGQHGRPPVTMSMVVVPNWWRAVPACPAWPGGTE